MWFKALNGLAPAHGGTGRYPGVGRWTKHLDPARLDPCRYGYHLARDRQVLDWLAPTLYEAEPCPDHDPVDGGDKWVTCRVRLVSRLPWDGRVARLFACDCAEQVVHLTGPDPRCVTAIDVARRYALGKATDGELAAARDDARDATDDAWAAAKAAAEAAGTAAWAAAGESAAGAVASAAVGYAARAAAASWVVADATRAAALSATWDAARDRQYQILLHHLHCTGPSVPPSNILGIPRVDAAGENGRPPTTGGTVRFDTRNGRTGSNMDGIPPGANATVI